MKTPRISVRLDVETIRRAQALIPSFSIPGRPATITDVYRAIIMVGLEDMEKRKPPNAGSPRGHPRIRAGAGSSR